MAIVVPSRRALVLLLACAGFAVLPPPLAAQSYTVTTLADGGVGSLRDAIDFANADGLPTAITFAPGLSGGTIALASPLPSFSEGGTTIDGDVDGDCIPDIGIDTSGAPAEPTLRIWTASNLVRGLALFGHPTWHVIDLYGTGAHDNVVECNWLGEDLARNPVGNGYTAMEIHQGAHDNRIGPGNHVAHTATFGIRIAESSIPGYPDLDALTPDLVTVAPTVDLHDDCESFRVRGSAPLADSGGHPFLENFGVRLTGTLGISVAGNYTFTVDLGLGDGDAARLTVAGDTLIDWYGEGSPPPATLTLPPGSHSLRLEYRERGGQATLALATSGPAPTTFSTTGNSGGCAGAQAGLCAQLYQMRAPTERNRVTQNSVWDNADQGLALDCCCGVDVNDPGDVDLGANTLLNHPVIAGVTPAGGGLYTISGTAAPDATVEVFHSDDDPTGYGEGVIFRGSLTADALGVFSGDLPLAPGDAVLTATATDAAGNTSEFGLNFALDAGQDAATVSSAVAGAPGATLEIPVYARDARLTPLGVDRPAGERIQSLTYRVTFAPASSIAAKTFARAGILTGLTHVFEVFPSTPTTASYVGTFDEATNPIPYTLDAAAPGDQVLKIVVTLADDAPAGTIALTLDPATTAFGNQAGTLGEDPANGWLALLDGEITVLSNAARGLHSFAVSSSAIQLDWTDPAENETGFRLERSTDGAGWSPVTTLGPDDVTYLDATGLSPATLYYYRLVTLIPVDSQASNVTASSTFPATAATICAQPLATPVRRVTQSPSVAWGGTEWGVAWLGREAAIDDEIWFRRYDATTLAPLGPPVRVAASASAADRVRTDRPVLAWSDSTFDRWGVLWTEGLQGEAGTPLAHTTFFALLAPDGSVERGAVRISSITNDHPWEDGHPAPLAWDGTHWGTFELAWTDPGLDLVYRRLDADGDVVLGPLTVLAPPGAHVADVDAAWNPTASKHGIVWTQIVDDDIAVYFQVLEESTGALEGSPTLLDDYSSVIGTYGMSVVADGDGWAVAWTDVELDPEVGDLGITWMRRFDSAGLPLGPAKRLSDDPVTDGGSPFLARKPEGGFAAFLFCFPGNYEVCRLEADANGDRFGDLTEVTPDDDSNSIVSGVGDNGVDFLVVFQDRGSGGIEIGGSLVPVADFSVPGPVALLTTGHDASSAQAVNSSVAPLGAGFVAVWTDTAPSGANALHARTWDGSGATIATLAPLDPALTFGRAALVSAGAEFAVAWRGADSSDLWFARYDASGSPIVGRTSVSTLPGYRGGIAMAFSGESYGLLWPRSGGDGLAFLRVAPDGTPQGAEVLLPIGNPTNVQPQIVWAGSGWAIAWHAPDNTLRYGLLAPDGAPSVLDVTVTSAAQTTVVAAFHLIWTGTDLGLAWSLLGVDDPPLDEIYFVRLGLDGTPAYAPVTAVSTPLRDLSPRLYWTQGDDRFHLVHAAGGLAGTREIALQADGTILPGDRYWTNRDSGGIAWNGVTLGYVVAADGSTFFETSECVTADATPPPCPPLAIASFGSQVRLDWDPVADPESGVFRYHVFRDGTALGKTWPATTLFDDGGYGIGSIHTYEVRALNAAWMESGSCTAVTWSTTAGDANGDGAYDVADIFYLINFFFADGPQPQGNADANGDDSVTVGDIFYMINNLFSGGPPPELLTGGPLPAGFVAASGALLGVETRAATAPEAVTTAKPRSRLVVGSMAAMAGTTVRVPFDLVDRPGTPLGSERPNGERVQALSLAVRCAPCDGVAALAIEPAGELAAREPLFATRPVGPGSAALLGVYDEATAPLFLGAATATSRHRVATLVVQISTAAPPGSKIDLRLDPGRTALSNQAGTTVESAGNGWLELRDGRLFIGSRPASGRR